MVTSMVATPQRMSDYAYSSLSSGATYCALITSVSRTDIDYLDRAQLNQEVIGYECESGKTDAMLEHLHRYYDQAILQPYPSVTALRNALETGEITVMVTGANNLMEGAKIVELFRPEEVYFVAAKDNGALLSRIDAVLTDYALRTPTLHSDLQKQYFPMYYIDQFTKSELEFISLHEPLRIAVPADRIPFSWVDKSSGTCRGIVIDILQLLALDTGLTFTFCPVEGDSFVDTALAEGSFDLLAPTFSTCTNKYNLSSTTPFLEAIANLGIIEGTTLPPYDTMRVGITVGCEGLQETCAQQFPGATIALYDNQPALLQALLAEEIDTIANNVFVLMYLSQRPE